MRTQHRAQPKLMGEMKHAAWLQPVCKTAQAHRENACNDTKNKLAQGELKSH